MFSLRLQLKASSYLSLPASIRQLRFLTSSPRRSLNQPDEPKPSTSPPVRRVKSRHHDGNASLFQNFIFEGPKNKVHPALAENPDQSDLAETDPVRYLRTHLEEFHKLLATTPIPPDQLRYTSIVLKRYSEGLEWRHQSARELKNPGADMQKSIPASYYRGGTSRAVMLRSTHVPDDAAARRVFFLHIMGSPDPHGRQLNGMGAGVSSLSKICIVSRSPSSPAADVDYTFVGVGIEGDETDYAGNCGNMSAAIGPFAFNERMLRTEDYETDREVSVMIYQTNTDKFIRARFKVVGGQAKVDRDTKIDGVSGMGTGVVLDFLEPAGSKTGKLLPTGNPVDVLCGVETSCVDAANPCVFVRAEDMGVDPTILPNEFLKEEAVLRKLESIRRAGAVAMGLCKEGETPPRTIPKVGIVSPPVEQRTLSGAKVGEDELDLVVRFISDTQPHRAIPVTAALCTAAAAKTEGSIVQKCLRDHLVDGEMITIGHPSGRIQVNAQKDENGHISSCSLVRTARRIWDGQIYWSNDPDLAPAKSEGLLADDAFIKQDGPEKFDEGIGLSREAVAELENQLEQVETLDNLR